MKIKKESRRLVLYTAIGKGQISKNGTLKIRHDISQKDYCEWKKKLLNKNGIKTSPIYNVGNDKYEFITKSYKFLKLYRKILYKPKKKIALKSIFSKITPIGLAIFYMDNGGLSKKYNTDKTMIKGNELSIDTFSSKEENQIIIECLYEKYNVKFTQKRYKNHYKLRCGTKEARKFIKIIEKFVKENDCMFNMINVKPEPVM